MKILRWKPWHTRIRRDLKLEDRRIRLKQRSAREHWSCCQGRRPRLSAMWVHRLRLRRDRDHRTGLQERAAWLASDAAGSAMENARCGMGWPDRPGEREDGRSLGLH